MSARISAALPRLDLLTPCCPLSRETLQGKYTGSKVHCRLSWSRDAATWQWVDKGGLTGADLIPLGAGPNDISKPGPNAFDSHMCAPLPSVPLVTQPAVFLLRHGL